MGDKGASPQELAAEAVEWMKKPIGDGSWEPTIDAIPRARELPYNECFRPDCPPGEKIRTAVNDMRHLLTQESIRRQLKMAMGPKNHARSLEYLDCITTNLKTTKRLSYARTQHQTDMLYEVDKLMRGTGDWDPSAVKSVLDSLKVWILALEKRVK